MERQAIAWEHPTGKSHPRIFLNEQARPDRRPFNFSKYHTFISHKGNDTNLAELVGSVLYQEGLSAYLDKWDPKVDGDSPELEEHIREIIRQTPSILAVVTKNTSMSWWVPFEIGVARETDSRIATFLFIVDQPNSATVELPSYLRTWPILASAEELKAWARALVDQPL